MIKLCSLASNMHLLLSQHLEFEARIVQHQSNQRATKIVNMSQWPQLFVVRKGTGSSNARNPPAARFALLISEVLLIGSDNGLTSVPLHCRP